MGRIRNFLSRVTLEGFIVGAVVITTGHIAANIVTHYFHMQAVKAQYSQEK